MYHYILYYNQVLCIMFISDPEREFCIYPRR